MSEPLNPIWSIGIYLGHSPFSLGPPESVSNPVLTRKSVSDVDAEFVADPFMVQRGGRWYMFFEVLNRDTGRGQIGLAVSDDGLQWTYQEIVLSEPFHLSYPYLFEWDGQHYMVPETLGAEAVRLYRADNFPVQWSCIGEMIKGRCSDPSVFRFRNMWWMFVCSTPYQHDTLRLYFSENLAGPWREHAASPIVECNKTKARPGGRVLVLDSKIIRFAQDCIPRYGSQLRAFEISELTTHSYSEIESQHSPVLTAGNKEWNNLGVHHVDSHLIRNGQWIACVDGFGQLN